MLYSGVSAVVEARAVLAMTQQMRNVQVSDEPSWTFNAVSLGVYAPAYMHYVRGEVSPNHRYPGCLFLQYGARAGLLLCVQSVQAWLFVHRSGALASILI